VFSSDYKKNLSSILSVRCNNIIITRRITKIHLHQNHRLSTDEPGLLHFRDPGRFYFKSCFVPSIGAAKETLFLPITPST